MKAKAEERTRTEGTSLAPKRSETPRASEEIEESVVIEGGRTLKIRPICDDDQEKLRVFHHHLSDDSIYCRYLSFHPELSNDETQHLTHVDFVNRFALVIEDGDDLVGVARYDRCPNTSEAEVAFVVRDDYQHMGLGHHLFAALSAAAWSRGVATFTAETLCRNQSMISVFRHSGFPMTSTVSAGQLSVRIPIDPRGHDAPSRPLPKTFGTHPWS